MTEKMTDDLREELEQDHFCGVPALEIIDAQAVVIERVRVVCQQGAETYARNPDVAATYREILAVLSGTEALAGAPEHTAEKGLPYCERCKMLAGARCGICSAAKYADLSAHTAPDDCDTVHERFSSEAHRQAVAAVDSLRPRLAAANAKVTQLTAERDALVEAVERRNQGITDLRSLVAAANAKVAELEASFQDAMRSVAALTARADAAERRALVHSNAKLDEQRGRDAAERKAETWERGHDYAWGEKMKAESEAATLRAEVEHLRDQIPKLCDECCYTHRPNEPHGRRRDVD